MQSWSFNMFHNVGVPDSNGVEVPGVLENHVLSDCTDFETSTCNPSEPFFSRNGGFSCRRAFT